MHNIICMNNLSIIFLKIKAVRMTLAQHAAEIVDKTMYRT